MLAGELGEPRRWAIAHQIAVGEFFAADFVPVSQAHIMADTESLGEAGVRFLEGLAGAPKTTGKRGSRRSPIRAASISGSIASLGRAIGWWRSSGGRSTPCVRSAYS
jgi:hypothetical protein